MVFNWMDWIFGDNLRLPGGDEDPPAGTPSAGISPGLSFVDIISEFFMGGDGIVPDDPPWLNLDDGTSSDDDDGEEDFINPALLRLAFATTSFSTLSEQFDNPYFSLAAIPMFGLFMMGRMANQDDGWNETDSDDDDGMFPDDEDDLVENEDNKQNLHNVWR
jgi:hypothetical protein